MGCFFPSLEQTGLKAICPRMADSSLATKLMTCGVEEEESRAHVALMAMPWDDLLCTVVYACPRPWHVYAACCAVCREWLCALRGAVPRVWTCVHVIVKHVQPSIAERLTCVSNGQTFF